ncbi:MAG: patatin-like phospholipase family protein [Proteobacteria bacterium]|nr:patatin-like phospholipase family protein [Pseudomonadota bacterium]
MAKKIKRALVIGGGSIKGAFEAGAIKVVLDSGFKPDVIYGVSVGALNGAFLADQMGRDPAPSWPEAADELLNFWRERVTSFAVLGKKRKFFIIGPKVLFGNFNGLLKMKRLRKLLHEVLDVENIAASPTPFYPGVADLEAGEFFYGDVTKNRDNFIDYVVASTREPILMALMRLDGKTLIDGGVRNISPLKSAIDAGANEIITIAAQPEKLSRQEGKNYGDLRTLAGRTIGIMTNEIVNNDLSLAHKINLVCVHYGKKSDRFKIKSGPLKDYKYIESTIIRPSKSLDVDITNFTPTDIEGMIKKGKERAKEALNGRDEMRAELGFTP